MGLDAIPNVLSASTGIGSSQNSSKPHQAGKGSPNKHQNFSALLSNLLGGNNKYNQKPQSSGPAAANAASASPAVPVRPPGSRVDIYV